jgi:hypothetical protein
MSKSWVNCGPKGIMIMKSSTLVNWMLANVSSSQRSRRGVKFVVMGGFPEALTLSFSHAPG